jgi:hypothetical protein
VVECSTVVDCKDEAKCWLLHVVVAKGHDHVFGVVSVLWVEASWQFVGECDASVPCQIMNPNFFPLDSVLNIKKRPIKVI